MRKLSTEAMLILLSMELKPLLPNDYKELTSLSTLSKIEHWETDKCPCRLCKTYIQRLGFV